MPRALRTPIPSLQEASLRGEQNDGIDALPTSNSSANKCKNASTPQQECHNESQTDVLRRYCTYYWVDVGPLPMHHIIVRWGQKESSRCVRLRVTAAVDVQPAWETAQTSPFCFLPGFENRRVPMSREAEHIVKCAQQVAEQDFTNVEVVYVGLLYSLTLRECRVFPPVRDVRVARFPVEMQQVLSLNALSLAFDASLHRAVYAECGGGVSTFLAWAQHLGVPPPLSHLAARGQIPISAWSGSGGPGKGIGLSGLTRTMSVTTTTAAPAPPLADSSSAAHSAISSSHLDTPRTPNSSTSPNTATTGEPTSGTSGSGTIATGLSAPSPPAAYQCWIDFDAVEEGCGFHSAFNMTCACVARTVSNDAKVAAKTAREAEGTGWGGPMVCLRGRVFEPRAASEFSPAVRSLVKLLIFVNEQSTSLQLPIEVLLDVIAATIPPRSALQRLIARAEVTTAWLLKGGGKMAQQHHYRRVINGYDEQSEKLPTLSELRRHALPVPQAPKVESLVYRLFMRVETRLALMDQTNHYCVAFPLQNILGVDGATYTESMRLPKWPFTIECMLHWSRGEFEIKVWEHPEGGGGESEVIAQQILTLDCEEGILPVSANTTNHRRREVRKDDPASSSAETGAGLLAQDPLTPSTFELCRMKLRGQRLPVPCRIALKNLSTLRWSDDATGAVLELRTGCHLTLDGRCPSVRPASPWLPTCV